MRKLLAGVCALVLAQTVVTGQGATATLDAAAKAMGITNVTSIYYSGSGSSYNLGQAVNASLPWPRFVLNNYIADINYAVPMMRQEMNRTNPDGSAPFGGVRQIQLVSGTSAWNIGGNDAVAPAPANVAERQVQIWLTPPGFIKAAQANRATVRTQGANKIVTFTTATRHRFTGTINANNLLERIETTLDNPVLGDMPVEVTFSNYQSFGDVRFPTTIVQKQGGHPMLELTVSRVFPNVAAGIDVPAAVRGAQPPPVQVQSQKLAEGVWYLTGGTHHSVVVEFADHLAVVEGPLDETRSSAVIAEARKLVPAKPIRYVVNTHTHFDHSGGLRTFVAEGVTVVTAASNKAYFEKSFAALKALNPDKLAQVRRTATVEGIGGRRVLTDATRTLELHVVPIAGHTDEMIVAYLPKEKILIEADAYTPAAAPAPGARGAAAPPAAAGRGAPPPPNPFTIELYNHVQRLQLDVAQIAALHGPRVATLADLRTAAGR